MFYWLYIEYVLCDVWINVMFRFFFTSTFRRKVTPMVPLQVLLRNCRVNCGLIYTFFVCKISDFGSVFFPEIKWVFISPTAVNGKNNDFRVRIENKHFYRLCIIFIHSWKVMNHSIDELKKFLLNWVYLW